MSDDDDRYEPLPDLAALPGWLWRRAGTKLRVTLGLLLLGAIGLTLTLAPRIGESRREREAAQARERAAAHARLIAQQRAEQEPRYRETRFHDPDGRLGLRVRLVEHMQAKILADARERGLEGPLLRVECERFPRAVEEIRPERDLSLRTARYSCLVVTSEFQGGLIGHRYRSKVDFRAGSYAFCKVAGRPGVERDPEVTTPKACGG